METRQQLNQTLSQLFDDIDRLHDRAMMVIELLGRDLDPNHLPLEQRNGHPGLGHERLIDEDEEASNGS